MSENRKVKLEFSIDQVNTLVNVLNTPLRAPTTTFAAFISLIQDQAAPQFKVWQEEDAANEPAPTAE